ncbi:MAG TPA: helix-turn-helix transcriptional regulator [Azospirillaceae bacterium]|nr:helix-turn-helix transcriptional regulator [Azospirillaceae bacterium]
MPVRLTLDRMLAVRRISGRELAGRIGITEANLSLLRTGKVKGLRFSTLARICAILDCKPGDILDYDFDPADLEPRDD